MGGGLGLKVGKYLEKYSYLDFAVDNPSYTAQKKMPIYTFDTDNIFGFPMSADRTFQVKTSLGLKIQEVDNTRAYNTAVEHIRDWVRRVIPAMQKATSTIHNCHYASITLDGENRQVCDFVPKTGNRVILCAGFNGWGFKYGSLIGSEFRTYSQVVYLQQD